MSWVCFNGAFLDSTTPLFAASNRAFHYGDGLFETILSIDGKLPFFDDHWQRLEKGMRLLKLQYAPAISAETLLNNIEELLTKNGLKKRARIRITAFRNDGGKYLPTGSSVDYLIEAEALQDIPRRLKDIRIGVYEELRKPAGAVSNIKSCNALIYVLASIFFRENHFDDCLLLSAGGNICEATSSNLFAVKGKAIYTPPLSEGPVEGVMRKNVIELAQQANIQVKETAVTRGFLQQADELFLTNAISGITSVKQLDDKQYKDEMAEYLADMLSQRLAVS